MLERPLITTIIPTYKRPQLLKKAIKSVLNQTYKNLQVCVYDNASGDETKEIVDELASIDSRVKYFCHKENVGSIKNFEFGYNAVNTPYFSFLSDDDFLFPQFYEIGMKMLAKYPEAGFFVGKTIIVDLNEKFINSNIHGVLDGYYLPEESIKTFIGDNILSWTSVLFNSEKAKKMGNLDIFEKKQCILDGFYLFRMLCSYPIIFSNEICAAFRDHSSNLSSNNSAEDMFAEFINFFEKLEKTSLVTKDAKNYALSKFFESFKNYKYEQIKFSIKNKQFDNLEKDLAFFAAFFNDPKALEKLKFFFKLRKNYFFWPIARVLKNMANILIFFVKRVFFAKCFKSYRDERLQIIQLKELNKTLNH